MPAALEAEKSDDNQSHNGTICGWLGHNLNAVAIQCDRCLSQEASVHGCATLRCNVRHCEDSAFEVRISVECHAFGGLPEDLLRPGSVAK